MAVVEGFQVLGMKHLNKSSIVVCTEVIHACARCKPTTLFKRVPNFVDIIILCPLKSRNAWKSSIADTASLHVLGLKEAGSISSCVLHPTALQYLHDLKFS